MGKRKRRKPHPAMPEHVYWGEYCIFCKSPNNCGSCKTFRDIAKSQKDKKEKGCHMKITKDGGY